MSSFSSCGHVKQAIGFSLSCLPEIWVCVVSYKKDVLCSLSVVLFPRSTSELHCGPGNCIAGACKGGVIVAPGSQPSSSAASGPAGPTGTGQAAAGTEHGCMHMKFRGVCENYLYAKRAEIHGLLLYLNTGRVSYIGSVWRKRSIRYDVRHVTVCCYVCGVV